MSKNYKQVYQFKIFLQESEPLIWRRIQVPENYTFFDLHAAIQDAMGWDDSHIHDFEVKHPIKGGTKRIGAPDEQFGEEISPEWEEYIKDYFSKSNKLADYMYDFGDSWAHKIKLEKILPREDKVKYPVCISGERACPPEDCGGIWEYMDILKMLKDPKSKDYKEVIEWIGEDFDPENFDPQSVIFT